MVGTMTDLMHGTHHGRLFAMDQQWNAGRGPRKFDHDRVQAVRKSAYVLIHG